MNSRLVVSTECPSCGAPLDFNEGSHAIRCPHCGSNLLVTGRGQILSYYISPKIGEQQAVHKARTAAPKTSPFTVVRSQLYFLPYYRLTGHDFQWKSPHARDDTVSTNVTSSILRASVDPAAAREWKQSYSPITPAGNEFLTSTKRARFRERYVEKNFLACELPEIGIYSLGVRPAALRLRLFDRQTLEGLGKIVRVRMDAETAQINGLKTADSDHILYRQVLGSVLSVIFFPLWVIETESQAANCLRVVDGVSGRLVRSGLPTSLYAQLERAPSANTPVVGFRPLLCPNCGWDLPVKPEDSIFICSTCHRAWQIVETNLIEISYQVAETPGLKQGSATYLPFWALRAHAAGRETRFFLPAFRYRRLKVLNDMARQMLKNPIDFTLAKKERQPLWGCHYDHRDALKLAQFVFEGMKHNEPQNPLNQEDLPIEDAKAGLVWFPFIERGRSLVNPFTQTAVETALLG